MYVINAKHVLLSSVPIDVIKEGIVYRVRYKYVQSCFRRVLWRSPLFIDVHTAVLQVTAAAENLTAHFLRP
jgi:hypothetical protein